MNADGYRKICLNQGEGQRGLINSRSRLLFWNALSIKKYRYVQGWCPALAPKEDVRRSEERNRFDPENFFLADQMGVLFGKECPEIRRSRSQVRSTVRLSTGRRGGKCKIRSRSLEHLCSQMGYSKSVTGGNAFVLNYDLNAMDS